MTEYAERFYAIAQEQQHTPRRAHPGVPAFIARLFRSQRQCELDAVHQSLNTKKNELWQNLSSEEKDYYDPLAVLIGPHGPGIPSEGWSDTFDEETARKILEFLPEED